MNKKFLVLLVVALMLLTSCQFFKSNDEGLITGEVIEIEPDETATTEDTTTETSEEDFSDILIRIEGVEGDTIELKPDAYDPDGDKVKYTYSKPFNVNGQWKTDEGDAGKYVVTVTVSDGKLSTSQDVLVIVKPLNKAPVIECDDEITFKESELIVLPCNIYDPEGENVKVSYDGWMKSVSKQTDFGDEGEYEVKITASDGERAISKTLTIVIVDLNRAPVVLNIGVKGDSDE
ncbi:MAG: hypothetical protein ABIB43_01850 [archaeon]|nr:hypothetical protein [Nanoarchaeota archaeon]